MITTGELPILKHREEILESVIDHQVTVVIGETGSGAWPARFSLSEQEARKTSMNASNRAPLFMHTTL